MTERSKIGDESGALTDIVKCQALTPVSVLITAGPTCEPIDPVRFISNRSSGRLGYALAEQAKRIGAKVTLISGPTALKAPRGIEFVPVVTAREMYRAALRHARSVDLIICAAAVADWRPRSVSNKKLKRSNIRTIKLVHNPDILATLCKRRRRGQFIVGFALETERLLANARKKLIAKDCDCIVTNLADVIGADKHHATILFRNGKAIKFPPLCKPALARRILEIVCRRACEQGRRRSK